MTGYYIACLMLGLIIAAFIPAMIAATKQYRFSRWYLYSLCLFPFALVHSVLLKKPSHFIRIYMSDKNNPSARKKKLYAVAAAKKHRRSISFSHIFAVFFSKLIFGAFIALALFAIFRTFIYDTPLLRVTCVGFAIIFSVLMSIVEICELSRLPITADEITKRALLILLYSIACSLPMFLIKTYILDKTLAQYSDFFTFFCAVISMTVFILLILRRQSVYYSFFSHFSDYCIISILAYAIYSAITLILLSTSVTRPFINLVAMPMQVLNLKNLADSVYIHNLSYIYSSALAHLLVEIIIFFSGLSCRDFKRKELAARIEYRSAAFRMSRKRILRRHIPEMESTRIMPLQNI